MINLTQFFPAVVEDGDLKQILKKNYSIEVESLKRLNGFDTINYHVKTSTSHFNGGQNYLLKIAPCTNPPHAAQIFHEQISLMEQLYNEIPSLLQRVFTSNNGKSVIKSAVRCKSSEVNDCHLHNIALLEYIEGNPMNTVLPFSLTLVEDLGEKYGQLSLALQNCPEVTTSRKSFHWDPKNVLVCEQNFGILSKTGQEERRRVCENFLCGFKTDSLPKIEATCREALIHADGTCKNILVHPDNPDCVRAILDFEDACHSYLVFECGKLLRSILTFVPEDALGVYGRALMKGFTKFRPLSDSEWDLLLEATLSRLLQHQISTLVASVKNPENSSYVLATYEVGWRVFDRLVSEDSTELLKIWRT